MKTAFFLLAGAAILSMNAQMGHMGGPGRILGTLPQTISSPANPLTPEKVALGRMLFYDARLSRDNSVSCNSCHDLEKYGADGQPFSLGVGGQKGGRNSPTVYHAAGHVLQFWDGRAATIEDQATGPVLNPVEMAMASPGDVEQKLRAIRGYAQAFAAAFPRDSQPVTFDHMALAIGAFERGLVTPSRWDRFVDGDRSALTSDEFPGFHEFMHTGCASCHNGAYIGGGSLQKLGKVQPWPDTTDPGREAVTKQPADHMVFKVPSLRNVAQTAPYFHNGSEPDLALAVRRMARHQLGVALSDVQVRRLVAWLGTLTGEIPHDYIRRPELPQ